PQRVGTLAQAAVSELQRRVRRRRPPRAALRRVPPLAPQEVRRVRQDRRLLRLRSQPAAQRSPLMTWLRALALTLVLAATAGAADWPQWLGSKRDGGTTEKVAAWKKGEEPKVAWHKAVGDGYSAPVVAGGRVFLHARGPDKDKEEEQVTAFDAEKGTELWK